MKRAFLSLLAIAAISFTSCSDDDDIATTKTVSQSFQNLPDVGSNYVYEGWLIVGAEKISTGRFTNTEGASHTSAALDITKVNAATEYVLTIEPTNETGADLSSPSGWIFSKGTFTNTTANPSTDGAIYEAGSNLETATSQFFLKAPSAGMDGTDANGIWWINALPPTTGGFTNLPTLGSGWIYEGWVVVNDNSGSPVPISTGKFSDPNMADDNNNEFKGAGMVPPFPGEDFIMDPNNKYPNVTFPIDLTSANVVISIEPTVGDDPAPFGLKPFTKQLDNQTVSVAVTMDNGYANKVISGTVTR
ncbi:anti-sigma factor [Tenacibaculum sp. S7007]|uniref:Anti-sigma factor n=1 Tax=Tenacibaculum pelagium TaxID=2759527 RepID=A0A839AI86_9FLAO|nr:anti-sigma factor [Tenacibaculum pelagium]MBA6154912.1 anti-sigma factor [Tenacibaculum pelagium]